MSVPVEKIEELHDVLSDIEEYRPKFKDAYARMYPFTSHEHDKASREFYLYQGLYNARCARLDPAVSPQVERFKRFLYGTWGQGLTLESLGAVKRELWFRHSLTPEAIGDMTLDRAVELLTAPPAEPPTAPPIILKGETDDPIVKGKRKERLTPGQYRVVKALLDAHPERLSKDTLANRANVEGPVNMIDRLRRDPDWAAVLDKPGKAHGGYGLRV